MPDRSNNFRIKISDDRKDLVTAANPLPVTDMMLDIPRGNVPGMSSVNKFGRNDAIASGSTEDIWDGGGTYSFPATALMTSISQTADQAALRGEIVEVQGLDANWNLVVQNATLDASNTTTVVTLATALIRVFRMKVLANVVSTSPIRVHNAGETVDYAVIATGNNQTLMAIYTVPADTTAYMTKYYATLNPGSGNLTAMTIRLWARDNENGYQRQLKHVIGLDEDGTSGFQHVFVPYYKFEQKTDIYIDGTTAGAAADISAGFDLIVIDN